MSHCFTHKVLVGTHVPECIHYGQGRVQENRGGRDKGSRSSVVKEMLLVVETSKCCST